MAAQCAACLGPICDRFVMQAANGLLQWHTDCLRCAECGVKFDESTSCFVYRGMLCCRQDFKKAQYHLELSTSGTTWSTQLTNPVAMADSFFSTAPVDDSFETTINDGEQKNASDGHHQHRHRDQEVANHNLMPNCSDIIDDEFRDSEGLMWTLLASPSPTLSLLSSTSSAMSSSYCRSSSSYGVDLTSSPSNIKEEGYRQQCGRQNGHHAALFNVDQSRWTTTSTAPLAATLQPHHEHTEVEGLKVRPEVVVATSGKTPRLRTVLNEHHLCVLRSCYAVTPRPDQATKDRLERMTGLTPRVIRVWFQNKRCKDKKRAPALSRR